MLRVARLPSISLWRPARLILPLVSPARCVRWMSIPSQLPAPAESALPVVTDSNEPDPVEEFKKHYESVAPKYLPAMLKWKMFYHKKPAPEFVVPAMMDILDQIIRKENKANTTPTMFTFAAACQLHPEHAVDWVLDLLHDAQGNADRTFFIFRAAHLAHVPAVDAFLGEETKRHADTPLAQFFRVLQDIPRVPISKWPIPALDKTAFRALMEEIVKELETHAAGKALQPRRQPSVYEISGENLGVLFAAANRAGKDREMSFASAALMMTRCTIESLYAEYCMTGEKVLIDRIFNVATLWSENIPAGDETKTGSDVFVLSPLLQLPPEIQSDADKLVPYCSGHDALWLLMSQASYDDSILDIIKTHKTSTEPASPANRTAVLLERNIANARAGIAKMEQESGKA